MDSEVTAIYRGLTPYSSFFHFYFEFPFFFFIVLLCAFATIRVFVFRRASLEFQRSLSSQFLLRRWLSR